MILSHKYKFVCLNPPKTGTGFRENLLKDYADVSMLTHEFLEPRHWNSTKASDYIKSINRDPNDYYWFTFVRNPWERMISWVNMLKNHYLNGGNKLSFDSESIIVSRLNSKPFNDYIYRDGKLLDFIGSVENLTEDLRFVLDKLNVSIDIPSKTNEPHKKNFKKDIRKELSSEIIKMIADVEKEVIELKNYKFEQ